MAPADQDEDPPPASGDEPAQEPDEDDAAAPTAPPPAPPAPPSKRPKAKGTTAQQRAGQKTIMQMGVTANGTAEASGATAGAESSSGDAPPWYHLPLSGMTPLNPLAPNLHGVLLTLPSPGTVQCTQTDPTHVFLTVNMNDAP